MTSSKRCGLFENILMLLILETWIWKGLLLSNYQCLDYLNIRNQVLFNRNENSRWNNSPNDAWKINEGEILRIMRVLRIWMKLSLTPALWKSNWVRKDVLSRFNGLIVSREVAHRRIKLFRSFLYVKTFRSSSPDREPSFTCLPSSALSPALPTKKVFARHLHLPPSFLDHAKR